MKKLALFGAVLMAIITVRGHAAQVTINIGGSQLLQSDGSTPVADGMLVQLLADTTGTFGAPTATSFTGTDPNELVLWSGTISAASVGSAGGFSGQAILTLGGLGAAENTGDYLLLRWFPTLSLSASAPGAGTTYGQFDNSNSSTADSASGSDIPWQIPATAAQPYTLNYLSVSKGGDEPNSAGVANLTVAPVPEPSSFSMMAGAFAVGAVFLARRR